jgi:anaerobic ribonucleoside-triphosphate reductase
MIRLDTKQVNEKLAFIDLYRQAGNAADGSKMDANANVTSKNIATLEAEINKDINIQINRAMVSRKIAELFSPELAKEYVRQIENHEIYVHDETSLKPYCVSVSMYPLLIDGLTKLGGESKAPKHLGSFCGTFINFVFAIS